MDSLINNSAVRPLVFCAAAFLFLFTLVFAIPSYGQQLEEAKLSDSAGANVDNFGCSTAISGDVIVVGSKKDNNNLPDSGSVIVYRYNGITGSWDEEIKLTPMDGAAGDWFGHSVDVEGDLIAAGTPLHDADSKSNSGSVYIFRYDSGSGNWIEEDKLTPADAQADDEFGTSVSFFVDRVLVGAIAGDGNVVDSGSAYVFRYNPGTMTWDEEEELIATDGAAMDEFGAAVELSGEAAVVGAPLDDDAGTSSGSAYIFQYDSGTGTWNEEEKLNASDAEPGDEFGYSVSLSGDVALVGAPLDNDGDSHTGSVYIYHFDSGSWNEQPKLTASDPMKSDQFGINVVVSDDFALIGAAKGDGVLTDTGSVYLFRFSKGAGTWSERVKLIASDGLPFDSFYSGLSLSGDKAVIGAEQNDAVGIETGAAYVYNLSLGLDTHQISAVTGGSVEFALDAGPDRAFKDYFIFGSVTGTAPGIALPGGLALPINPDIFTNLLISQVNSIFFSDFQGSLDATGRATAIFDTVIPLPPSTAGLKFFFAFVQYNPLDFASSPAVVEVVP